MEVLPVLIRGRWFQDDRYAELRNAAWLVRNCRWAGWEEGDALSLELCARGTHGLVDLVGVIRVEHEDHRPGQRRWPDLHPDPMIVGTRHRPGDAVRGHYDFSHL